MELAVFGSGTFLVDVMCFPITVQSKWCDSFYGDIIHIIHYLHVGLSDVKIFGSLYSVWPIPIVVRGIF